MPREHQKQFDSIMLKYQGRLGRKVNNTMVFKKTMQAAIEKKSLASTTPSTTQETGGALMHEHEFSLPGTRNTSRLKNMSPVSHKSNSEVAHVARIRSK